MDAFSLNREVISEYKEYSQSFLHVKDPQIDAFIRNTLAEGRLWPEPLIQLAPVYAQNDTVAELVANRTLHPLCGEIFKSDQGTLSLYKHQSRALELARELKHYVVTTGTGSGKSLTYVLPIINDILQNQPEQGGVRAILVYPMNALINSQYEEISKFLGPNPPLQVASYTGQTRQDERLKLQESPPHILLTNYVMLELMLTRPQEAAFVDASTTKLKFFVLDELHTYRGRQGADVAMLVRRLRERSGNRELVCIGTSATMVSDETGDRDNSARKVAEVATKLFGLNPPMGPDQVIQETLHTDTVITDIKDDELREAVLRPLDPDMDFAAFQYHPLAGWIESTYRVDEHDRRPVPITLQAGAERLSERVGLPVEQCRAAIEGLFALGARLKNTHSNKWVFTPKLHQFISQGGAVYATLEETPHLTFEGQYALKDAQGERLLYPLVFCRICGQHYYEVTYDLMAQALTPAVAFSSIEYQDQSVGYFVPDVTLWDGDISALPEEWLETTVRSGLRVKSAYREAVPIQLHVALDGECQSAPGPNTRTGWFLKKPFRLCLSCGEVYTKQLKGEFSKLSRLSSEGRSSATTITALAMVRQLRGQVERRYAKLLSFMDNRQDASLQAGHFNDFVEVVRIRTAVYAALQSAGRAIGSDDLVDAVWQAMAMPIEELLPPEAPPPMRRRQEMLISYFKELLELRLYEDLRRSWRFTQPNLEQTGLLRIRYADLDEAAEEDVLWQASPHLAALAPEQRAKLAAIVLDYMRSTHAIFHPNFGENEIKKLSKTITTNLHPRWSIEDELPPKPTFFQLNREGGATRGDYNSFGVGSKITRFLRRKEHWVNAPDQLTAPDIMTVIETLMSALGSAGIIHNEVDREGSQLFSIKYDAILWDKGDGSAPYDIIRSRSMSSITPQARRINHFFRDIYTQNPASFSNLTSREHTGQVSNEDRIKREDDFRNSDGQLPILFCSPTMELGIDIGSLNVVHLRNMPPSPANYAQRAGRAGRSGQSALITTYCLAQNGHDQYFFQRPSQMVAGAVVAPQIELTNRDLLRAHLHAVWIAATKVELRSSITDLVDINDQTPDIEKRPFPLKAETQEQLALSEEARASVAETCRRILHAHDVDEQRLGQSIDDFIKQTLDSAPESFNRAFDRWRNLYRQALYQYETASAEITRLYSQAVNTSPKSSKDYERLQKEALNQLNLLRNDIDSRYRSDSESDFYPYRYLASEGFLPGYNFPRLPVRAILQTQGDNIATLARPRFLAIRELAPQNYIYHEGNRYQIKRAFISEAAFEKQRQSAKVCTVCSYFHDDIKSNNCSNCHTPFNGDTSRIFNGTLVSMPTMVASKVKRITCEEEERSRSGYAITEHYTFTKDSKYQATVSASTPFELTYGPAATLYAINNGWRKSKAPGAGFYFENGRWIGPEEAEKSASAVPLVQLIVSDTRNILLLNCPSLYERATVVSLQQALIRAIVETFQLEADEIDCSVIGPADGPFRLLFWEAAEGGVGVLRHLVDQPSQLAVIAKKALEICHADATGADIAATEPCSRACYRCLLSYRNQLTHALIDRHLAIPLLVELASATVTRQETDQERAASIPDDATPTARELIKLLLARGRTYDDLAETSLRVESDYSSDKGTVWLLWAPRPEALRQADDIMDQYGERWIIIDPKQPLEPQLGDL